MGVWLDMAWLREVVLKEVLIAWSSCICVKLRLYRYLFKCIYMYMPGYRSQHSDSLRAGWSGDRIPVGPRFSDTRPDRLWDPPSLLDNEYRVKGPGRGVYYLAPSRAEVKERVEIYLYPSFGHLCVSVYSQPPVIAPTKVWAEIPYYTLLRSTATNCSEEICGGHEIGWLHMYCMFRQRGREGNVHEVRVLVCEVGWTRLWNMRDRRRFTWIL